MCNLKIMLTPLLKAMPHPSLAPKLCSRQPQQSLLASFAIPPSTTLPSFFLPSILAPWKKNIRQVYKFRTCQITQMLGEEFPALTLSANLYQLVYVRQPLQTSLVNHWWWRLPVLISPRSNMTAAFSLFQSLAWKKQKTKKKQTTTTTTTKNPFLLPPVSSSSWYPEFLSSPFTQQLATALFIDKPRTN